MLKMILMDIVHIRFVLQTNDTLGPHVRQEMVSEFAHVTECMRGHVDEQFNDLQAFREDDTWCHLLIRLTERDERLGHDLSQAVRTREEAVIEFQESRDEFNICFRILQKEHARILHLANHIQMSQINEIDGVIRFAKLDVIHLMINHHINLHQTKPI